MKTKPQRDQRSGLQLIIFGGAMVCGGAVLDYDFRHLAEPEPASGWGYIAIGAALVANGIRGCTKWPASAPTGRIRRISNGLMAVGGLFAFLSFGSGLENLGHTLHEAAVACISSLAGLALRETDAARARQSANRPPPAGTSDDTATPLG
jgi:hypothetical protein